MASRACSFAARFNDDAEDATAKDGQFMEALIGEERIDTSASLCSYKRNRKLHILHMEHLVQGKGSDLFVYLIRDADLEERKIPSSRRLRA
jgi:NAD(P)H-flavin reductase